MPTTNARILRLARELTDEKALLDSLEPLLEPVREWKELDGWRARTAVELLPAENVFVHGPVELDGNLVVRAEGGDAGRLVVIGDLRCRNLSLSYDSTLVVIGDVHVQETLLTEFEDSVTAVHGAIEACLVVSGGGAHLQHFGGGPVKAEAITGEYLDANWNPVEGKPVDLRSLVDSSLLDTDEWDDLSPEEQKNEDPALLIQLDERKARIRLEKGRSLFRQESQKE